MLKNNDIGLFDLSNHHQHSPCRFGITHSISNTQHRRNYMNKTLFYLEIILAIIVGVWMATPEKSEKEEQWVVYGKGGENLLHIIRIDSKLQPQEKNEILVSEELYQKTGLGDTLLDLKISEYGEGTITIEHSCEE